MNRPSDTASHADDLMGILIGALGTLFIWIATLAQPAAIQSWSVPQDGLLRWFNNNQWVNEEHSTTPIHNPTVLLIHGLDEPGGIWDQVAPALANAGYQVIRFDYPNDQAVTTSAQGLHKALARLSDQGLSNTSIVAHSMGGLVARESLTAPTWGGLGGLGGGTGSIASVTIDRLIMIGTPNEGSPLARLRAIGDLRERVYRWFASDSLDPTVFATLSEDGDGQAGIDLLPGSTFLTNLNSRPMPPSTTTTCIVGRIVDPLTTQSNPTLDQAANTLGDGVVSVQSATLNGCTDIVPLVANHRTMLRTIILEESWRTMIGSKQAPEPQAIAIILDRLANN